MLLGENVLMHTCHLDTRGPDSNITYVSPNVKKMKNKLLAVVTIATLAVSVSTTNAFADNNPNVKSISIEQATKISKDLYLIKFKACIRDNNSPTPTFVINSDISSKTVKYQKTQQSNTCKNYDTTIKAKYDNRITIQMIET